MSKIKKSPWGEGAILSPQNPLIGKARRLIAGTSDIERAGTEYALLLSNPIILHFSVTALWLNRFYNYLQSLGEDSYFGPCTLFIAGHLQGSSVVEEFKREMPRTKLSSLTKVQLKAFFDPSTYGDKGQPNFQGPTPTYKMICQYPQNDKVLSYLMKDGLILFIRDYEAQFK